MRSKAALLSLLWCLMGSALVLSQPGTQRTAAGEPTTSEIPGVVAGGTRVQVLHTWEDGPGGEGPIGMSDGSMLFTQPNANKLIRIDPHGTVSVFLDTAPNRILALAYDLKGRLIATASPGQPTGILALAPTREVVADKLDGQAIVGPNDLVIDLKGGVYFTARQPHDAVYYLRPDGKVVLAAEGLFPRPNGIQLSPDGKVVYVCAVPEPVVKALDVQPDGRLSNPRDFARLAKDGERGGADGMAVDAAGRLYVSGEAGVRVFSPQGQLLGIIPTPKPASNLAFGGLDRKTLYVVSSGGGAYKVAMRAEGMKTRAK